MISESTGRLAIARNAGATIFLPSEDEWYKAAYYDAVSTSYFDYPAGSDARPPVRCPGRRRTPRTATMPWAISPTWGATRAQPAPTAPSTRAATSGSGTRPSSAARTVSCGAGAAASAPGLPRGIGPGLQQPGASTTASVFASRVLPSRRLPSLSRLGVALAGGLLFAIAIVGLTLAARRERG